MQYVNKNFNTSIEDVFMLCHVEKSDLICLLDPLARSSY